MRAAGVAVVVAVVGCVSGRPSPPPTLVDPSGAEASDDGVGWLTRELELEVLASYDRLALDAAAAAAVIDPGVGLTAIGVGPDELGVGGALRARWPVSTVDGQPVTVVSRALELHLSADRTVGWTFDALSLHLPVCGRTATVPLRAAQIYVRDSERWTLVSEHLGYAQAMGRWLDAASGPTGPAMPRAVEQQPESAAALEALASAFAVDADRVATWDGGPGALAVWPDPLQVLRGGAVRTGPSLADALDASALGPEGTRLVLGPTRQVAIVATTLLARAERAAGPVDVRLRATAVVERGAGNLWRVRMAMVSAPITVAALVGRTVGETATAVTGSEVRARCDGERGGAPAPR